MDAAILQIRQDSCQTEQSRKDIPALGYPRDRLCPEGMNSKEERRKRAAENRRRRSVGWARWRAQPEEVERDKVKEYGVRNVQKYIGEVISRGLHPPNNIIQTKRHPGERNIVPHLEVGKHPLQLGRAQPAVTRIGEKINLVIPVDKPGVQCRQKHNEGRQCESSGYTKGRYPTARDQRGSERLN